MKAAMIKYCPSSSSSQIMIAVLGMISFLQASFLVQSFSRPMTTKKVMRKYRSSSSPFIQYDNNPISFQLHYSKEGEDDELNQKNKADDDEEAQKMARVRSLQSAFYAPSYTENSSPQSSNLDSTDSTTTSDQTFLNPETGIMHHLPIWRVSWTELPGRSNVLCINDPIFTNMFESILRNAESSKANIYFGHLYLEGGNTSLKLARMEQRTQNIKRQNSRYGLKSWHEELTYRDLKQQLDENENSTTMTTMDLNSTTNPDLTTNTTNASKTENVDEFDDDDEYEEILDVGLKSSVVGTLMRIVDNRRMKDGRLLLLVQAMERFVVSEVHQEFPYAIADVQLLLDEEELAHSYNINPISKSLESDMQPIRALSIHQTFQYYHDYEYDATMELPVKQGKEISVSDVFGPYLKKVLPFVPYSTSQSFVLPPPIGNSKLIQQQPSMDEHVYDLSEFSLEYQLQAGNILQEPPKHPEMQLHDDLSVDELEIKLWICMDEFLRLRHGLTLSHVHPPSVNASSRRNSKSNSRNDNLSMLDLPIDIHLLTLLPHLVYNSETSTDSNTAPDDNTSLDCCSSDNHSNNGGWPSHFILHEIIQQLSIYSNQDMDNDNMEQQFLIHMDPKYPSCKRQKRLSYMASSLLEHIPIGGGLVLRQILLEIPSTKARLCTLVERYEMVNAQLIGSTGEFM